MALDERFWRECRRKAFHQLLLLYLAAYHWIGFPRIVPIFGAWVVFVALAETFRLKTELGAAHFGRWFGGILREKEKFRYSGTLFAAAGLWLVFFLFGDFPRVVTAACLYLTLGDATSPLVGLAFGYGPYTILGTRRSLDGTIAGFLVALAIGVGAGFPIGAALGAAAAFSVVDTFPVKPDDNFWIPIAGAAALRALT